MPILKRIAGSPAFPEAAGTLGAWNRHFGVRKIARVCGLGTAKLAFAGLETARRHVESESNRTRARDYEFVDGTGGRTP
jgi:hypothetical protein